MAYYMGVDVGTSSLKTILTDEKGVVLAGCAKNYQFSSPCSGYAEQDPEEWWFAAVETIHAVLGETHLLGEQIEGIGFSGQMHGLVPLGADGKPVRRAILHCDARSTKQLGEITRTLGTQGVRNELMNPVFTGFLLPSLLWVRDEEPENYAKIEKVCLPKDYIKFRLTGELTSDYSDAGATLAFDLKNSCWNKKILKAFHLPEEWFPPCYDSYAAVGTVSPTAAGQTGLSIRTKVVAGGGDQVMQRLGNGADDDTAATVNIGTSGQVCFQSAAPLLNPALNTNMFYGFDKNTWILYGAIMNAGLSLSWWRSIIRNKSYDALNASVEKVPVGSRGLIFLPYLNGERTPHLNPNISGAFIGANLDTTRACMSRAVMEGVTYALYQCLEICRSLDLNADVLISSGGGSHSRVWRQIQADVFGIPLKVAQSGEQACLGACICAAVGCGQYASVGQACRAMVRYHDWMVEPIAENHERYQESYQLFKEIYASSGGVLEKAALMGRRYIE
ncbi:xylulokinase [Oscillibacter sp.]|uniref:xylulokinase n=1 Tax=Oscillibacter sp. TaxID=1945593 RepID=UPI003391A815